LSANWYVTFCFCTYWKAHGMSLQD